MLKLTILLALALYLWLAYEWNTSILVYASYEQDLGTGPLRKNKTSLALPLLAPFLAGDRIKIPANPEIITEHRKHEGAFRKEQLKPALGKSMEESVHEPQSCFKMEQPWSHGDGRPMHRRNDRLKSPEKAMRACTVMWQVNCCLQCC